MTKEEARQEIRREWRRIIPTIAQPAQRKVNGEESYICPLCGHGTHGDGLTYNPRSNEGNGLKCFGCDFSGDIIDLYQRVKGADYNAALSDLAQEIGLAIESGAPNKVKLPQFLFKGTENKTTTEKKTPQNAEKRPLEGSADYTEYYKQCQQRIEDPAAIAYLEGRQVLGPAIEHGAGYDPEADPASAPGAMGKERKPHPCPRIIIPCSKGSYVARSIDPETPGDYKKLNASRAKGADALAIFNEAALYAQGVQEVFVTEGAFDALSIMEVVDAEAIALNGVGNARALLEKLKQNPTSASLILCLDNDSSGRKATEILKAGLPDLEVFFLEADINNGCKDANEALCKDRYEFRDLVLLARSDARKQREQAKEKARQEARERQQRTGAGMIDSFLEVVKTRKYEPVPTGITDIDRAIGGGFFKQQLILLGAAPGAGKTALAQWIFERMAKQGHNVLYLNLEMSREQMLARSISRIAAMNGHKIRTTDILQGYKWTAEQEEAITLAAEKYRAEIAPCITYNPDGVTANLDSILEYIEAEAQRAEAADLPAPCVVLDYLQIISGKEREDDTAVIKRAVSSLKKYAIDHNTFVFVIIAHNRQANRSGDVSMEAGRDTSALEYSADLQLGLAYTLCMESNGGKSKEELTPDEKKLVTLRITKGRFGGSGTDVNLFFDGETMSYSQMFPDTMDSYRAKKPATSIERIRGRR